MLKPKNYAGTIPPEIRSIHNGRIYWTTYFGDGIWSVEPDDDAAALVHCCGNWQDAIREFELR